MALLGRYRQYTGNQLTNMSSYLAKKKAAGMPITQRDTDLIYGSVLGNQADAYGDMLFRNQQLRKENKRYGQDFRLRTEAAEDARKANVQTGKGNAVQGLVQTGLLAKSLWPASTAATAAPITGAATGAQVGGGTIPSSVANNVSGVAVDTATAQTGTATPATSTGFSWGGMGVGALIGLSEIMGAKNPQSGGGAISNAFQKKQTYNDQFNEAVRWKSGLGPSQGAQFSDAINAKDTAGMREHGLLTQREWAVPFLGTAYDTIKEGGGETLATFLLPEERFAREQAGKTVICTELHRQGYMPDEILELDAEFGRKIDSEVYAGYRKMAAPIVRLMKKSKLVTFIVAIFAIPWSLEMAHRMKPDKYECNWLGKAIMSIGLPLCRYVGKFKAEEVTV